MYSRAPRTGFYLPSQTGPFVCPNTYMTDVNDGCNCKGQNMAPFLTSAPRMKCSAPQDIPSPDTYYPHLRSTVLGCSSLRNRAVRFPPREFDSPELPEPTDSQEETPSKGYMYHCAVPFTLEGFPPSIPPKGHCEYVPNEDGAWVSLECCPEVDCSPRVPTEPYWKGCRWSRDTSQRQTLKPSDTPAPNAYDLEGPTNWAEHEARIMRCKLKKQSYAPRYLEALQRRLIRENLPSPAEYTLGLKVVRNPKRPLPGRIKPKAPFLVSAKRFVYKYNDHPGPDTYMDPRTALDALKKPSSLGPSCFLVNARRFPCPKTDDMPAPNAYMPRPPCLCSGLKNGPAPFNCSAERKTLPVPADQLYMPGPDAYDRSYPPRPIGGCTAPFKDTSRRGGAWVPQYDASAASYNVTPAFNYLNNSRRHRKVKRANFDVTAKRFRTNIDVNIPGPIYNLQDYKPGRDCNIGRLADFARRFPKRKCEGPSPAEYSLHPAVFSSVLRRTFNVTLDNPLPQHGGIPDWRARLRPIKRLRAYIDRLMEIEEEQKTYAKQILKVANALQEDVIWDPKLPQRFQQSNKRLRKIFEKHHSLWNERGKKEVKNVRSLNTRKIEPPPPPTTVEQKFKKIKPMIVDKSLEKSTCFATAVVPNCQ